MCITFRNHIASYDYNVWRLGPFWKYHLPKLVATLHACMRGFIYEWYIGPIATAM